ncbi:sensor histidine kinase [Pseudobutyrivibrio sp.]|uniref:sensor histidine kinase n=1 Tax=Pseudobutyrivibrio sp. TaxID=2014367 RepID=UPI0025F43943|nr:sensor histidine kinase [Pseudobutyrivibrio sp.]MBR5648692.1 sensor histidine kinase [Pseudobutyrivibrio sp.]
MKLFGTYIKSIIGGVLIFIFLFALLALSFFLYELPLRAVIYPILLCSFIGLLYVIYRYYVFYKRHKEIEELKNTATELIEFMPNSYGGLDDDYCQVIENLVADKRKDIEAVREETGKLLDYYTLWVHQIKTPIASMRLRLQREDSELSRSLLSDLGRIERYVEMVITYLRLEGSGSDYIFKEYDLDSIIGDVVKKFAGDFILRKLKLNYRPVEKKVLTDEKWLSFVIDQVLSNALKYTKQGEISIYLEEPLTLCIADTGIGISPEDLPRIFERNYTGVRGRADKRASGLGLYLCNRICKNLNHEISAESQVGQGTKIKINLETKRTFIE